VLRRPQASAAFANRHIRFQPPVRHRSADAHGFVIAANLTQFGDGFDIQQIIRPEQIVSQQDQQLGAAAINLRLIAETRQLTDGIAHRVRVQYFKWRKHDSFDFPCLM
jgi:hypothetical protein